MSYLSIIFLTMIVLLLIDLPVILYFNRSLYQKMFNTINQGQPNSPSKTYLPGLMVYLLLAIGLYYVVIMPLRYMPEERRLSYAVTSGMILGFVIYGVYDFTNMATISAFDVKTGLIDIVWGTILCGLVAFLITKYIQFKQIKLD